MVYMVDSLVRQGLAPCPLQMQAKKRPNLRLTVMPAGYDSYGSPLTTGPSSAASSIPPEFPSEEAQSELAFPDVDPAYHEYHTRTFLGPFSAQALQSATTPASSQDGNADQTRAFDDPEVAIRVTQDNKLTADLFAAVCPLSLNETSIFVYGRLAEPQVLAGLFADSPDYRAYEQAARIFPATLHDYALGNIGDSAITSVVPKKDSTVQGFVLFSTSIRERKVLETTRGKAFERADAVASVEVDGHPVRINVATSVCTESWRRLVTLS